MEAVVTLLIEVLITKCLTAPLHGKVKVEQIIYTSLLKYQLEAAFSAKHVLFTYIFLNHLSLNNT